MRSHFFTSIISFIFICMPVAYLFSQTVYPLYQQIPNSIAGSDEEVSEMGNDGILRISKVSVPTLTMYQPAEGKGNGTSVIICPGGGYSILAASHEGADVAKKLAEMGVTAFVLKYRLPDSKIMNDQTIGPLQDAQRAIQLVRENAVKWNLKSNKVGIMGFSAGGHLASTAGTHFSKAYIDNAEHISLRPDFMILAYPVISFNKEIGHGGSKNKLLGADTTAANIKKFSNELQVTDDTPPTFLVHAKDDGAVDVKNTLAFEASLKKHHVPVTVYLYEKGGHGFGMVNKTSPVRWMDNLQQWMKERKLI